MTLGILGFEVFAVTIYLILRRNKLDSEASKNRCGYIFEELNHKIRGAWALSYPIFYQVRFVILAICTIYWGKFLVVQVMVVALSSIFLSAILGFVRPQIIVKNNYKEIWNESVILIILDLLLFSSDPKVDPEGRSYIGYTMIGVLGVSLCFS